MCQIQPCDGMGGGTYVAEELLIVIFKPRPPFSPWETRMKGGFGYKQNEESVRISESLREDM